MALHILLADDSVPAQNMGKKILTDAGYEVTAVSNGLEALRKIAEITPDIVILDIFMPGYTGFEICQKLRASNATATLPVILTVGKLEPYRTEDGERVHSNAVIVKPFASTELIAAVRSLVGGPSAAEPQQHSVAPDPLEHAALSAPAEFHVPVDAPAQSAEAAPEEPADEPLFTYGSSLVDETESLRSNMDAGYGTEPPLSDADVDGPESLMFNPDAKHTPFSASATDLLSSVPDAHTSGEEPPFSEFDLEPSGSVYSGAPDEQEAVNSAHENLDPLSPAAEAHGPTATEAAAPVESPLDVPILDPLLEVSQPEAPPSILDRSVLEVGELPETLVSTAGAETEEPLSPEEEARHKAFEDLFNSSDLPPLEESLAITPPVPFGIHDDVLPSISTKHATEDAANILPDPELEPLGETFSYTSGYAAPTVEPEPELLEEEPERSAIGSIPERDVLFEHSQEPASQTAEMSVENLVTFDGEQFPLQNAPLDLEHHTPQSDFAPEVQSVFAHASEPEPPLATQEEEAIPSASQSVPHDIATYADSEPEPAPEAVPLTDEHFPVEHLPAGVTPAEVTPSEVARVEAPVEAEPVEVAPAEAAHSAPEASEPAPLEPAAPEESHTVLPSFAELASGAGLAASFPTLAHLAHLVESEAKRTFASPEPTHHEPEPPAAVSTEAVAAPPQAAPEPIAPPAAAPPVTAEPMPEATPLAAQPESVVAPGDSSPHSVEVERVHQAVERVFDRFKPLLVAAIVRELARHD